MPRSKFLSRLGGKTLPSILRTPWRELDHTQIFERHSTHFEFPRQAAEQISRDFVMLQIRQRIAALAGHLADCLPKKSVGLLQVADDKPKMYEDLTKDDLARVLFFLGQDVLIGFRNEKIAPRTRRGRKTVAERSAEHGYADVVRLFTALEPLAGKMKLESAFNHLAKTNPQTFGKTSNAVKGRARRAREAISELAKSHTAEELDNFVRSHPLYRS